MTDTQLDLDAIEARATAATTGPWERRTAPREGESVEQKAEYLRGSLRDNGEPLHLLIATPDNEPELSYIIPALTGDGPRARDNAEFIAHARTDVPALVAALRKAEAQVAAVLALCDEVEAAHAEYVRQIESGESYTLDRFIGPAQANVAALRAAVDGAS